MPEYDLPRLFDTVIHMLQDAGGKSPGHIALRCEGREMTYQSFVRCVAGFARELEGLGARGGRVALICGNSIEIVVASFSAYAAGAQLVPINPLYTQRELSFILEDADPVVTIYDTSKAGDVEPLIDTVETMTGIAVGGESRALDDWVDQALALPLPTPEDFAVLQYTGGTTGRPKGVMITHGQIALNMCQREVAVPTVTEDERVLCVMPLFHVFATSMCMHLAVQCRGTMVILKRYHPETTVQALVREKITFFPAGPTVFNGLLAFDGFQKADFSYLRFCVSGSAPLAEETLKTWKKVTGIEIVEGFGQSEAGPVLTMTTAVDTPLPGSVGKPLPYTAMQIVDVETGTKVLGPGEQGEIRAKGPQIMSGYRNRPDETAQALRDGWLYTGDIGECDEDGNFFIRDRKKDMAIVGGYNVYPREIDEVLYAHPAVLEAAAIGIKDNYLGEVIYAQVVLKKGVPATVDDLDSYCRENLAKYKVPRKLVISHKIPKTTVGKIDKAALRSQMKETNT